MTLTHTIFIFYIKTAALSSVFVNLFHNRYNFIGNLYNIKRAKRKKSAFYTKLLNKIVKDHISKKKIRKSPLLVIFVRITA